MSIKCYEYFGCKRINDCPFYRYEGKRNCWEVEIALTPYVSADEEDKFTYCKHCLYYQDVHKIKD